MTGCDRKKRVAIVITLSDQNSLTEAEQISLRHLQHYLSQYDKYFVAPVGCPITYDGIKTSEFPKKFFGSLAAHSLLLLSPAFYRRFQKYEYILIHHLDCLILSSHLEPWCERGYDYVGAPWIHGPHLPWLSQEAVGNGGLSLRRVESFISLLDNKRPWINRGEHWERYCRGKSIRTQIRGAARVAVTFLPAMNDIQAHLKTEIRRGRKEDRFLAAFVHQYDPKFAIPSVDEALRFSFDANPRICYERNGRQLPFGCHGWDKYDKAFWLPYILH